MLSKNEPCPCGSGKKYKNCCEKKELFYNNKEFGQLSNDFSQYLKKYKMNCVFPLNKINLCNCGDIIGSHSLQEHGVLDKISVDGHVYYAVTNYDKEKTNYLKLGKVGINNVTKFFCLCLTHDTLMFSPIENSSFQETSEEQKFLFCYRSFLFDYFRNSCSYYYHKNLISSYNIFTVLENVLQYKVLERDYNNFSKYFEKMKNLYLDKKYDKLKYKVFTFDTQYNFCCTGFSYIPLSIRGEKIEDYFPPCFITAFPQDNKFYIIVGYFEEDKTYYDKFWSDFMIFSSQKIQKIFNVIIPLCTENIAISPNIVNSWGEIGLREYSNLLRAESRQALLEVRGSIESYSEQLHYNLFC